MKHKVPIIISGIGILCWFRILFLKGIWWDDWAWVWHYFGSKDLSEFIVPFKSLRHELDACFLYANFKLLDILPALATSIWSAGKFIIFILNSVLLYFISSRVLDKRSLLPAAIAIVYLTSPIVHNLCLVELCRRVYMTVFLLSVLLSLYSISGEKVKLPYYLSALALAFISMAGLESFIFFEMARPVLVLYVLSGVAKHDLMKVLKKTFFYWLPFAILGALILIWRVGLLSPRTGVYAHVYDIKRSPLPEYMNFVFFGYMNSCLNLFGSYVLNFDNWASRIFKDPFLILQSIIVAITAAFIIFGGKKRKVGGAADPGLCREARQATIFGAFLIIIGLFPHVLSRGGYESGIESRHGLLACVGVSVFMPSLFFLLYYKGLIRAFSLYSLLSAAVLLGTIQCNIAVKAYDNDWEQQRSFWRQFAQRVPDIKDKTCLLVDMPREEGSYLGGWRGSYEFAGPLNLLYAKSRAGEEINNHFAESLDVEYDERTGFLYVINIKMGEGEMRFETFKGTQSYCPRNLIVTYYRKGHLSLNDEIKTAAVGNIGPESLLSYTAKDQILHEKRASAFPFRWIVLGSAYQKT